MQMGAEGCGGCGGCGLPYVSTKKETNCWWRAAVFGRR